MNVLNSKYFKTRHLIIDSLSQNITSPTITNFINYGDGRGRYMYYVIQSIITYYNIDKKLFSDKPYIGRGAEKRLSLLLLTPKT